MDGLPIGIILKDLREENEGLYSQLQQARAIIRTQQDWMRKHDDVIKGLQADLAAARARVVELEAACRAVIDDQKVWGKKRPLVIEITEDASNKCRRALPEPPDA